jgi:hypothetical protein
LLLLLLLMTSELLLGAVALMQRQVIGQRLSAEMLHSLRHEYGQHRESDAVGAAWRSMQRSLQCCGHESYRDWYGIDAWPTEQLMPGSCCRKPHGQNVRYVLGLNASNHSSTVVTQSTPVALTTTSTSNDTVPVCWSIHTNGCYNAITKWLHSHAHLFALSAAIVAILQFAAFASAIYLLSTLRFRYDLRLTNPNKVMYDRVRAFE